MPRPDGSVTLPMDMPVSNRRRLIPLVQGLVFAGSSGEIEVPFSTVPWNSTESSEFPAYEGSTAAATIGTSGPFPVRVGRPNMNALRPKWGVAINAYSPIAHRTAAKLRDGIQPRAISARGVGAVTQRPRGYAVGYVTRWPVPAPQYPSWSEAPGARNG